MTYSLLVFLSRKPGTTPQEFRDYYTNSHMPMFRQLVGSHVPARHIQRYVHRTTASGDVGNTQRNPSTPASVYVGTQADFDYDVVVTIDFKDEAAFRAHYEFVQRPEIAATIAADEERFLDRTQTRAAVLGETIEVAGE
ncbi:EthD domain-containing protein [Nemania sp. NC0429]|nr:EthD domain-containing protein [Nemania sp. NC0429]